MEVEAAVKCETLRILDADEAVPIDGIITDLSRAPKPQSPGQVCLAVCGERAGQTWARGQTDEAMRIEDLCNRLVETAAAQILCVYPLNRLELTPEDEFAFRRACREHSHVHYA